MKSKRYAICVERVSDTHFVVLIHGDNGGRMYKWPDNEELFATFMVDMLGDYLYQPITADLKSEIHARTLLLLRRLEQGSVGN